MEQLISIKSIKQYSNFVATSKVLCSVIALLLISFIVLFSAVNSNSKQLKLNLTAAQEQNNTENRTMFRPRFFGTNANNELYKVFAAHASQDAKNKNIILLDDPFASIKLNDDTVVTSTSQKGMWLQSDLSLELIGAVSVLYGNDYKMDTGIAKIDLKNSTIFSHDKTFVHSSSGKIEASGFTFFQKEKKVIFNGPVRTKLLMSSH